ncbi:MAG TPA: tetratricopeptide repeat protein, partial [Kofleriaceae bacterium]
TAAVATPPPMDVVAKPTPPPMAVVAPPNGLMTLPAWPPTKDYEDWDNPESGATSVGNRISPTRPVSADFKSEDSVIVDLNAKPTAEKPRRPQTYPVIQTSEQAPSTSGAFVMPTADQPNATQIAPERVSAPELPPPPIVATADRASSPGWNTPLPEQLPGEPIAAPAAPGWPSAAGLVYEPSAPLAREPAVPSLRQPLVRRRGVVIAIAGAATIAIVIAIAAHGSKQPDAAVATPTTPATTAKPTARETHAATTRPGASAAVTPSVEPSVVAPTAKAPAKPPVAMRHLSRSKKKPVVVDYDKKPVSSPLDPDEALAQARAAYAIGNQHLFAGEGDEAVAAYRRALADYPSYAAGYRGLGLAFAQLDDKPAALAAFKTYVKLAPTAKDVALIQKRIRTLSVR